MVNKKITVSALSILFSLSLMGSATFAYFNDTATSSNNTFSAGTFDLKLQDDNENFSDGVTASFTSPVNWAPGDKFVSFLCLKNYGTIPIQQILLKLNSNTANEVNNDLDQQVYVSKIELGNVTANPQYCETANSTGTEALSDFTNLFNDRFGINAPVSSLITQIDGTNQVDDDLLDGTENKIDPDELYKLRVEWTFSSTASALNVAGKSLDLDLIFTATQNEQ